MEKHIFLFHPLENMSLMPQQKVAATILFKIEAKKKHLSEALILNMQKLGRFLFIQANGN